MNPRHEKYHKKSNFLLSFLIAERKANTVQNALEEAKTMLEQADRARKMAEQELSDTNETLADLTVQNQSLSSSKRKLEQDLADLRHEADEALNEARQMVSRSSTLDVVFSIYFLQFFDINLLLPHKRCLIISHSQQIFQLCSNFDHKIVRPLTSLVQAV